MMKIRDFRTGDTEAVRRIHAKSGLPANCFPHVADPLFFIRKIAENGTGPAIFGGLRLTGEIYLLVDHGKGTPEERWNAVTRLAASGLNEAAKLGLADVTCWLPREVENSFAKRLIALGFTRSPWNSYTARLE